jgi:hypothetical protein
MICRIVHQDTNHKEDAMKTYKAITAALIFAASPAMGQPATAQQTDTKGYFCRIESYKTMDLPKASKNYAHCLRSDNDGIVESALAHTAYTKMMLPTADLKEIRTEVEKLANSDRTPVIRYKAYLASMVFTSPGLFTRTLDTRYKDGDEFFSAVDSQLRHSLLGYLGE